MPYKRGFFALAAAILGLYFWYFHNYPVSPAIGFSSFGALCILLSFARIPDSEPGSDRRSAGPRVVSIPESRPEPNVIGLAVKRVASDGIVNAFTIDLEDYFHTEVASHAVARGEWDSMPARLPSTMPRLLDLLDRYQVRATVFVLGWVARTHPGLVREIARRGHEIACHSDQHRAVFQMTPPSFYEDTLKAKQSIEDVIGESVTGYRAPSFSITPGTEWAFDILTELGFLYDSSVNPVNHKFYGNPSAPRFPYKCGRQARLLEIPVATWRVGGRNLPVSGGAYLRVLPYQYVKAGLAKINEREKRPFTMYVHPWEIDSYSVPLNLKWSSHLRQTFGTEAMESRLEALLKAFHFGPIASAYADAIGDATRAARTKTVGVRTLEMPGAVSDVA